MFQYESVYKEMEKKTLIKLKKNLKNFSLHVSMKTLCHHLKHTKISLGGRGLMLETLDWITSLLD